MSEKKETIHQKAKRLQEENIMLRAEVEYLGHRIDKKDDEIKQIATMYFCLQELITKLFKKERE